MNHDVSNTYNPDLAVTKYAFGWRWIGADSTFYRDIIAYDPETRVGVSFGSHKDLFAKIYG